MRDARKVLFCPCLLHWSSCFEVFASLPFADSGASDFHIPANNCLKLTARNLLFVSNANDAANHFVPSDEQQPRLQRLCSIFPRKRSKPCAKSNVRRGAINRSPDGLFFERERAHGSPVSGLLPAGPATTTTKHVYLFLLPNVQLVKRDVLFVCGELLPERCGRSGCGSRRGFPVKLQLPLPVSELFFQAELQSTSVRRKPWTRTRPVAALDAVWAAAWRPRARDRAAAAGQAPARGQRRPGRALQRREDEGEDEAPAH